MFAGDAGHGTVVIDGDPVRLAAGEPTAIALVRRDGGWRLDDGDPSRGCARCRGSWPITDCLMDRTIYVYGTRKPDEVDDLRRSAEVASRGWPLWSHAYHALVMPEDRVTADLMRRNHVVVFGTAESSTLIAAASPLLPIHIEPGAIVLRDRRLTGREVGVRMIYPNPLAEGLRYLVVQAGVTAAGVQAGNRLPTSCPTTWCTTAATCASGRASSSAEATRSRPGSSTRSGGSGHRPPRGDSVSRPATDTRVEPSPP